MAEMKPTSQERVKEIVAGIEDHIQELFQTEKYLDYLQTMSRFHQYSYNNTLLIHMQRPDATFVCGYNKWRDVFGRHVKKGEKGITIIAPAPYKQKTEVAKVDPDTQAPMLDTDGKVIMEERTVDVPLFRPVKVFDYAQTDGKPLPELAADLPGDVLQYEVFMEALRRTSPVPIDFKPLPTDYDGLFSSETQRITIREGMSEKQTVCAAVHEIAHSILHNRAKDRSTGARPEPRRPSDRQTDEVQALCSYFHNAEFSKNSS